MSYSRQVIGVRVPAGAVPQTIILAQNSIKEFYCASSSVIPKWNISGAMVQGDYQQPDFLKEVLSIEIKLNFGTEGSISVINSTLCINGSVENNGTILQCTTDLAEIGVTVMVQGNKLYTLPY